jgi:hypothetical protein
VGKLLNPKPLDVVEWLSCSQGLPKGHFNLWPTKEARDKYWDSKHPMEHKVVNKRGKRRFPRAKKDDPILGDVLSKMIKDAEKSLPNRCGKTTKDGKKACSKMKLEVKLNSSPSMKMALQHDPRVKSADRYENTYNCKTKKWTKKTYTEKQK